MYLKNRAHFDREKSKKLFKMKKFGIGDKFYGYDGYLNHIINIFDDVDERIIVYKCWLPHKARWSYNAEPLPLFLYTTCLMNDIPMEKRPEFFRLNGIDENTLEIIKD